MSEEFGLFSDEGLVEDGFITREDAVKALEENYSDEDDLHVGELCPEHPEEERHLCESCNGEEEDDDLEEEESDEDNSESYPIKY